MIKSLPRLYQRFASQSRCRDMDRLIPDLLIRFGDVSVPTLQWRHLGPGLQT
jgi:hypothetical protein